MAYSIDIINTICTDLGGIGGHDYEIDGLNEICTLIGATAGHKYNIDALNAICASMGYSAGHKYNIDALNAIVVGGSYAYEDEAWADIQTGSKLNPLPSIVNDGNTVAHYDRTVQEGVVKDVNGVESIYWDLNVGNKLRGNEETSGTTVAYGIYEITATQTDHFFIGCKVGDVFPAVGGKTIDGNNKVKRVLGNHACQPVFAKRPINGVFDGVDDFMKTPVIPLFAQPSQIQMVAKQLTWKNFGYFFDGNGSNSMSLAQYDVATKLSMYAGVGGLSYTELGLNHWSILQLDFDGVDSNIIANDYTKVIGNVGTADPQGITIGARGRGDAGFGNIEFNQLIVRNNIDNQQDKYKIYNYLYRKNNQLLNYKYVATGYKPDVNGAMYVLKSPDAINFRYAPITPVYQSASNKIVTPSILYLNGTYYVCHPNIQTAASADRSTILTVIKSTDLVSWQVVADVEVASAENGITWLEDSAWFIDDDGSIYIVLGATNQLTWQGWKPAIIQATNADLTTWSKGEWMTGSGYDDSCLDPYLIKIGSEYCLFWKDELNAHFNISKSSNLKGGYSLFKDLTSILAGVEAPMLIKIDGGWRLYLDYWSGSMCFYSESFDNLNTWSVRQRTLVNPYLNHFTICKIGENSKYCYPAD